MMMILACTYFSSQLTNQLAKLLELVHNLPPNLLPLPTLLLITPPLPPTLIPKHPPSPSNSPNLNPCINQSPAAKLLLRLLSLISIPALLCLLSLRRRIHTLPTPTPLQLLLTRSQLRRIRTPLVSSRHKLFRAGVHVLLSLSGAGGLSSLLATLLGATTLTASEAASTGLRTAAGKLGATSSGL